MQQPALPDKKYLSVEDASLSVFQKTAIKKNRHLYMSSVMVLSIGINVHCIWCHVELRYPPLKI